MDINNLQIGLQAVVGLAVGLISALSVWFKMKAKVDILTVRLENTETNNEVLHKRISKQKDDLKELEEKINDSFTNIRDDIHDMERNILDKITEFYKQQNKKT